MSINWSEIATGCGLAIGTADRGVLKVSLARFGLFALFVPNSERSRVLTELAEASLSIRGSSTWTLEDGEKLFVAVVKAGGAETLRVIAQNVQAVS